MPIALSGPALCGVDEVAMRSTQIVSRVGRRSNECRGGRRKPLAETDAGAVSKKLSPSPGDKGFESRLSGGESISPLKFVPIERATSSLATAAPYDRLSLDPKASNDSINGFTDILSRQTGPS
jgi:hypothetical protein